MREKNRTKMAIFHLCAMLRNLCHKRVLNHREDCFSVKYAMKLQLEPRVINVQKVLLDQKNVSVEATSKFKCDVFAKEFLTNDRLKDHKNVHTWGETL